MDTTSKLFYSVVVIGMALAAEAACSSDTSPAPTADAGGSHDGATVGDSGGQGGDASADALAGWFCCG